MKKLQTVLAVLLCLSLIACSQQPTSSRGGGEVISGGGNPTEIPFNAPSNAPPNESALPQSGGETVIENIPQEEQLSYFRKYIEPYYIAGMMYSTWSDPEEIQVEKLMRFFTCNEYDNYYNALEDPLDTSSAVPAEIVEGYITRYFDVDPEYLRTAQNYHFWYDSYRWMENGGIGGGPGVTIERIEKDGERWKFICRDEVGNLLSVTLRVEDENNFRYIAGEGLEIPSEEPPPADDRLDAMALGVQARMLTEHIALSLFRGEEIRNGDCPFPKEEKMLSFTLEAVYFRNREEYMYHSIGYQDENRLFHFPEDDVRDMVYEVFGFEDWTPDKSITEENYRGDFSHPLGYNPQEKDFTGWLEFGIGTGYECRFMATLVDADSMRVEMDYDLYTDSGFPYQRKIAAMTTEYAIRFRADDTPYLRYEGTVVNSLGE